MSAKLRIVAYILRSYQRESMKAHSSLYCYFFYCGLLIGASVQVANASSYISIGRTSVKANELVYGQPSTYPRVDYKLSHLIWSAKNVSMLTAGTDIPFENGIVLNIEGKFSQSGGDGVMDDYDWQDTSSSDWSDWSHHDDSDITDAKSLDINVDFITLGNYKTKFALFAGYKYETWSWESRGGSYIYSTKYTTDRVSTGTFTSGQPVITYKQDFSTPYLGFKISTQSNAWTYKLQYQFSNSVSVSTVDNHILRPLVITNNYAKGRMRAYKIDVGYQLTNNLNVFFRYDEQDYDEVKGGSSYSGSSTGSCVNCAGTDNLNKTLSIGAALVY